VGLSVALRKGLSVRTPPQFHFKNSLQVSLYSTLMARRGFLSSSGQITRNSFRYLSIIIAFFGFLAEEAMFR
jgi:hypothetical protein